MSLPVGFIEMATDLLGAEAPAFLEAMQRAPSVSVRLNPRKPGAAFEGAEQVKWCSEGFYLPERPLFTLDPLLHAGAYYVQDASSMIYFETVRRILAILGDPERVSVLDLCAAPGGKTTAMIDALPDGSRVVANEYVAKRAAVLRENLSRWGFPGATATNRDSAAFKRDGSLFDIVAVDAPCSGEGMMRKDETARAQWSPQLVEQCASLQREILTNAAAVVKPGGFLIYSTCTFNHRENEENLAFAVETLGLEPVELSFPQEWGIPRGIGTPYPAWRFMPHNTRGEGLFLAVLRAPGEFVPSPPLLARSGERPEKRTPPASSGKPASRGGKDEKRGSKGGKKEETVPEIDEILSVDFDRSRYPEVEVNREQAVCYLRREAIVLPPDAPRGIVIITYGGLPLGPAKNIGSRANNLYPKNRRILHL